MVGSFLNVLIARLPYEKSIIWPSSRCFTCFHSLGLLDNLPIIGYLRLRGKCRYCRAPFSSRYLWVELGTGLAFLGLFLVEILFNCQKIPALDFGPLAFNLPPWQSWVFFAYHAFLLSALIAAAAIDAEHRIIPPLIPYTGLAVGIIGGALLPWPWPNPPVTASVMPKDLTWAQPMDLWGKIPLGLQPWPFWGPTFQFAPPGTFALGLITAILGALAGSLVVRLIKWLFEVGFGREAMGLGDADLLMMAGAFLGWQIAVLSLFVGAVAALFLKVLGTLFGTASQKPTLDPRGEGSRELPFGPGLALGVVVTWFSWRWLVPKVQFVFFDAIPIGLSTGVMCIGMIAAGLLLRRPIETPSQDSVA
jgi:leader peptidase (prepilin peptidase)/N-methyltransferase